MKIDGNTANPRGRRFFARRAIEHPSRRLVFLATRTMTIETQQAPMMNFLATLKNNSNNNNNNNAHGGTAAQTTGGAERHAHGGTSFLFSLCFSVREETRRGFHSPISASPFSLSGSVENECRKARVRFFSINSFCSSSSSSRALNVISLSLSLRVFYKHQQARSKRCERTRRRHRLGLNPDGRAFEMRPRSTSSKGANRSTGKARRRRRRGRRATRRLKNERRNSSTRV